MVFDLLIVGAGLSGLFAANLAIDQGLSVHVVSAGRGGLSLSRGCIDVYYSSNPSRSIRTLPGNHPYRILPAHSLKDSVGAFKSIVGTSNLGYQGGISSSIPLLSALGTPFKSTIVPGSLIKGRLDDSRPISIAGLINYRDFWPKYILDGAKRKGVRVRSLLELPLLDIEFGRDYYATDIANLLQDPSYRQELWRAWKPKLAGERRVGIPAVLGLTDSSAIHAEAEEYLGVDLFEIPSLPPSLPGLRLEYALKNRCQQLGVQFTEGPRAFGRIDGRSQGRRAAGIQIETAGKLQAIDSQSILLTTGGFLHGGMNAYPNGDVRETVFGMTIETSEPREGWIREQPWGSHDYSRFGLRTDEKLRPLDRNNKIYLENVYAAGGILGGSDRTHEGSRQGIDLSTAFHAIETITSQN